MHRRRSIHNSSSIHSAQCYHYSVTWRHDSHYIAWPLHYGTWKCNPPRARKIDPRRSRPALSSYAQPCPRTTFTGADSTRRPEQNRTGPRYDGLAAPSAPTSPAHLARPLAGRRTSRRGRVNSTGATRLGRPDLSGHRCPFAPRISALGAAARCRRGRVPGTSADRQRYELGGTTPATARPALPGRPPRLQRHLPLVRGAYEAARRRSLGRRRRRVRPRVAAPVRARGAHGQRPRDGRLPGRGGLETPRSVRP